MLALPSALRYPGPVPGLSRRFLWTICLTYVALALAYNALTPIGEAPDELAHFEYARLLLEERRLPGARDELWQGHQPPLYYLVQAAWGGVIRGVSGCRIDPARLPGARNPRFLLSPDYNFLVHAPTEALGAWTCQEWHYHALRLLSTAFTLGTILLTFGIAREAAPGSPVLVAVAGTVAALLPSHVSISAMLNNDALVNLLIVGTTYLVLAACRTGETADLAKAGVLAAVAATAKLSGLYLFGLLLFALAIRRDLIAGSLRPGRTRAWLVAAGVAGLLPVTVLLRNLGEWGDPFGVGALEKNLAQLSASGHNPPPAGMLRYYLFDLPELLANGLLVAFGAVNFRDMGYPALAKGALRVVAAGLVLSAAVRAPWRALRLASFGILAAGFALFFLTYLVPGYRYRWLQVRYFFNQLPLIALVMAVGLLAIRHAVERLGLRVPDGAVTALVYVYLVAVNLLVLAHGIVPHLYRYVGIAG